MAASQRVILETGIISAEADGAQRDEAKIEAIEAVDDTRLRFATATTPANRASENKPGTMSSPPSISSTKGARSVLKRHGPSHRSPNSFSTFPHTPSHCCVLIHLGVLEIFPGELLVGPELLIGLVLFGSTDVCLIVSRVGENVIRFLALFDHGHVPGRKILELLLLGGRFGSDDLKAGGHEHVLSVLHAGLCAGAAD